MASKKRSSPDAVAVALRDYASRTRETNDEIAQRVGVTEGAVRLWRVKGRQPKNRLVRANLRKMLGLPPEGAKS